MGIETSPRILYFGETALDLTFWKLYYFGVVASEEGIQRWLLCETYRLVLTYSPLPVTRPS